MACIFQALIGGKFAPVIGLRDEDMDTNTMITTNNTAKTVRYSGRNVAGKRPWVTKDFLDLCDERKDLNKKRYEAERAKEYRKANKGI